MIICWRCDLPIGPGEEFDSYAKVSMSGPGIPIHLHKRCPVLGRALRTLRRRRAGRGAPPA